MYIALTIVVYFVSLILAGLISCFPYIRKLRGILLPISSMACLTFIELYRKDFQDSDLAQYAILVILLCFAYARGKLYNDKKLNRCSKQDYKSKVVACYMATYAVIIFLAVAYSGYFDWLFRTTSKVMIVLSAMSLIGITLDSSKWDKNIQ